MGNMGVSTKLPNLAASDGDEVTVPALPEQGRTTPPQAGEHCQPSKREGPKGQTRPHPTAL